MNTHTETQKQESHLAFIRYLVALLKISKSTHHIVANLFNEYISNISSKDSEFFIVEFQKEALKQKKSIPCIEYPIVS